ncbi:hypothetical protein CTAYLR_001138 [Chrysophaeum taylorii]|uniref:Pre-mRNA-splicing factor cwc2 n=1 Tax=Chrysophaeum taylorii TaxID=2483200 RepID=A0AAD7UP27_9STRA|nr:hypothetical protein CTAYLR_001138 [Chrysophaeum taylorii]
MPEKGTVVPLAPSQERLGEAGRLEKPQNFVPETGVSSRSSGGLSRHMIPVGVVGKMGSAYTLFEKNWVCEECQTENYASRARCIQCRAKKKKREGGLVHGSAANDEATTLTAHGEWKEIFDPSARHLYYVNTATGESQWERPKEMGPTPHASGWFGRGAAGSTAASGYERNNDVYVERPARRQVEYIASKNTVLEGAYEYNIYWGKYVGDHWKDEEREKSETRCVLATDAGYTKADKKGRRAQANFCLFFARGSCALGPECRYFHRIPAKADLERLAKDEARDCFGRERHKDFRDDMTGVGAMMKPCRTLYVGGLVKAEYADPAALEETIWRHFGEWGELENVNLVSRLSIAFVRYRYRSSAEFAREAMSNNSLDHDENLNLRWAHDDPNPVARDASARADADALVQMMNARGATVDADADHPADYHLPAPKRLKTGDEEEEAARYPDTDPQYEDEWRPVADTQDGSTYWWNPRTNETSREAPHQVADANADRAMAALDAADKAAAQAAAAAPAPHQPPQGEETPSLPAGWAQTVDPASGATYFYHAATQATTWTRPAGG